MNDLVPLCRAISKLGYASRTEAAALISAGEITINGKRCTDPEFPVSLKSAKILHGSRELRKEKQRVILFYKPKSVITSRKDEKGRPTVYTLLPAEYHSLHCVGRLDFATTGLLLLTNDTKLSSWLTDPKNSVPRVYLCTVRGNVTPEKAAAMLAGLQDEGQFLKPDEVVIRKASGRESHLVITLTGGKNREIRRLCSGVGHEVTKLKRVSYGALTLEELAPGEFREIDMKEVRTAFPDGHF